jgi:hypothetical protein
MTTRLKTTLDPNLYTQIGLDSGSLTMLGSIVHQLGEPGQYRGAVHQGPDVKAVFFITADPKSPVAQVTVDLAALDRVQSSPPATGEGDCCCSDKKDSPTAKTYTVNPRGYVLFHVSGGSGGYYVHLRRADAPENDKGYETRVLKGGDVFTAMILRPGTYAVSNSVTKAAVEVVVKYPPPPGKTPYVPGPPVRIDCTANGFEPKGRIELGVGQGMAFTARVNSRIQIKLEKPDDGPPRPDRGRTGFQKLQAV